MKRLNLGVLCGGKSPEHEISLLSAQSVINAINKDKYDVTIIAIDKDGKWFADKDSSMLLEGSTAKTIKVKNSHNQVILLPHGKGQLIGVSDCRAYLKLDVVFPVLHGLGGEDGMVQGLLELAEVPFVGAGVLGSAIGMDKDVMKRLLRDAKIAISNFLVFKAGDKIDYESIVKQLSSPLFIKPANTGSSVGVSKAKNKQEFDQALKEAFQYDTKIIIEEFIDGREIECSVLGNENPIASLPGEIISHHEFYSYEAKYIDKNGATLQIPADLPPQTINEVQHLAIESFKVLECSGMARVDVFVRADGRVYVNEINTIPGFTSISMYPKMLASSGIDYAELIEKLIQLAQEKFQQKRHLKTGYL